jgi:hypothetical protein
MPHSHPFRRIVASIAAAAIAAVAVAVPAAADNIKNFVANGVGVGNALDVPEGTEAVVPYRVERTGPTCDAADGTPVTITINVAAGVTATPGQLVFSSCDDTQSVAFSAPPGTYNIPSVTWADQQGDYGTVTTAFVLRVEGGARSTNTNTAPDVTISSDDINDGFVEANTTRGAVVSFTASAQDAEDGEIGASCEATSPSIFALGEHSITCSAVDSGGLGSTGTLTFDVVDTTAPALTVPTSIYQTATSASGNVVEFAGLSASDIADPAPEIECTDTTTGQAITSGARLLGTHAITCTATDESGNQSSDSFTVRVMFDFLGFRSPIDVHVRNSMKAGSTAPMKFRVADGVGGYIGDLSAVVTATSRSYVCTAAPEDNLEEYAMGGTALRYDTTAQQFIFNWQAPKQPGTCWQVKVTLADGTAWSATFGLK